MTAQTTIRAIEGRGKRKSAALLGLGLGVALSALVALAGPAQQAEAAFTEKVVFASNRTTGTGVDNPTGDFEIFRMNPDGTGVRQLTTNTVFDFGPTLSPDKTKVAYHTYNKQTSNPEGDNEIYIMNASDGKEKKNLTNNGSGVYDYLPVFSPGGKKIAYSSSGKQASNPEGDFEVYTMRAVDGANKKNLSNNGVEVAGAEPVADGGGDFSPDGDKITYLSYGKRPSNPEGDSEIYRLNASDGKGKKNLTNNGMGVEDSTPQYSPAGNTIAYESQGLQSSNPEGDSEIYRLSSLDGSAKKNLTNNDFGVDDNYPVFSPGGKKIAYNSRGIQNSNPEGDSEIYRLNTLDGSGQTNLTNNGDDVDDDYPFFSSDGSRIFYETDGVQQSNPEGDSEIYRLNTLDGSGQTNLINNGAGVYDGVYPD